MGEVCGSVDVYLLSRRSRPGTSTTARAGSCALTGTWSTRTSTSPPPRAWSSWSRADRPHHLSAQASTAALARAQAAPSTAWCASPASDRTRVPPHASSRRSEGGSLRVGAEGEDGGQDAMAAEQHAGGLGCGSISSTSRGAVVGRRVQAVAYPAGPLAVPAQDELLAHREPGPSPYGCACVGVRRSPRPRRTARRARAAARRGRGGGRRPRWRSPAHVVGDGAGRLEQLQPGAGADPVTSTDSASPARQCPLGHQGHARGLRVRGPEDRPEQRPVLARGRGQAHAPRPVAFSSFPSGRR